MRSHALEASDSLFSFRTMPLYAQTKIFLVAGSGQSANFAQEILDQKKIWLKAGFSEDEIACYYVIPSAKELRRDERQFLGLAPELSECYPADVSLLRRHLQLIARGSQKPPFLYLYVTSHGAKPLSYTLLKARQGKQEARLMEEKSRYPLLNQYFLRIDSGPEGEVSFSDLLKEYEEGKDPEELFMTPHYLRNLLEKNFKDVPKFVVLQGCYTGGFADHPEAPFRDQTLKSLSNLTLLTASRFDRTSFGCQPGIHSTYFGGIFNEELYSRARDPRRMDWETLFERVKDQVKIKEQEERQHPPSEPVFFSNYFNWASPSPSIFGGPDPVRPREASPGPPQEPADSPALHSSRP